jgi:hypothetical protein
MTVYGRRAAYYTDNGEDALVMWSRSLRDADYLTQIRDLRDSLARRLPEIAVPALSRSASGATSDHGDQPLGE